MNPLEWRGPCTQCGEEFSASGIFAEAYQTGQKNPICGECHGPEILGERDQIDQLYSFISDDNYLLTDNKDFCDLYSLISLSSLTVSDLDALILNGNVVVERGLEACLTLGSQEIQKQLQVRPISLGLLRQHLGKNS